VPVLALSLDIADGQVQTLIAPMPALANMTTKMREWLRFFADRTSGARMPVWTAGFS
jgi:hypothetical protein